MNSEATLFQTCIISMHIRSQRLPEKTTLNLVPFYLHQYDPAYLVGTGGLQCQTPHILVCIVAMILLVLMLYFRLLMRQAKAVVVL